MTEPSMQRLTVKDFRSIKGEITVGLDAPIVLVHGNNGAGKTSLLTAIELALTGEADSLVHRDHSYLNHLVHRGAPEARVTLSAELGTGLTSEEIRLVGGKTEGRPLLPTELRRTYLERCYLAQSTLNRLLEIYQDPEHGSESPLTRFVKDVLRLDRLDALVDGLYPAGNITRLRKIAPSLPELEFQTETLNRRRFATDREVAEAQREVDEASTAFASALDAFGLGRAGVATTAEALLAGAIPMFSAESEMGRLRRLRQEVEAIRSRYELIPHTEREAVVELEEHWQAARAALSAWQADAGTSLDRVLGTLRAKFPDVPTVEASSPAIAFRDADLKVRSELERSRSSLEADATATDTAAELAERRDKARSRLAALDAQVQAASAVNDSLVRALSEIAQHVTDDFCPVCSRDFQEQQSGSLREHLDLRISKLSASAAHLSNTVAQRAEAARTLRQVEQELETAVLGGLPDESRLDTQTWVAELNDLAALLDSIAHVVDDGSALMLEESKARAVLVESRSADSQMESLRSLLAEQRTALELGELDATDSIERAIDSTSRELATRLAQLEIRAERHTEVLRSRSALVLATERRAEDLERAREERARHAELASRRESFDRVRAGARELEAVAARSRADTVRKVFDDSLNKVWRDLFVRLVPGEPFLPAFRIPESTGAVTAELHTVHRDGGASGTPEAMLSAGNLNTSALTLFLALHLSVQPKLPWLVLDDPVQSMDEVHIAQLAALLRTLGRQHGRRLVIAVHERSLFDYLAFELTPAFQGDRLITIELARGADGQTSVVQKYHNWVADPVVVAG